MFLRPMMLTLMIPLCLFSLGCSKDCADLCEEGKEGNCTAIKADCDTYCDALTALADASGCSERQTTYTDCLNEGDSVCDESCEAAETSLTECMSPHCIANPDDKNCQTVVNAF